MGLDPDEDVGTIILDPNFDTGLPWSINLPWQYIGNKADYDGNRVAFGNVWQFNIITLIGGMYTITFEIGNALFTGASALYMEVSGRGGGGPWTTNGIKTATFFTPQKSSDLRFFALPKNAGDHCWVDNFSIEPASNYVRDILEIVWPGPQKYEFLVVGGGRYNQNCASRNGKTKCLIAFDA